MPVWHLLLLAAAVVELPPVEISTPRGERHLGRLAELNSAVAVIVVDDVRRELPFSQVLEIRFPATATPPDPPGPDDVQVQLADGSQISGRNFGVVGGEAHLQTAMFGAWQAAPTAVSRVRFGPGNSRLNEAWAALVQRESKTDTLVIRKGELLDHLSGVIGDVDDKVHFLLEGEEIPVGRDRVFGLIYARRPAPGAKPACQVALRNGDLLQASRVEWNGAGFEARLTSGGTIALPVAALESLDFSAGKLKYLSQLEPREVKYTPYFDVVFPYRRDRSLDGGPLRLKGVTYTRGLALHSRTLLRYRIAGEYSRFQAVMGIDQSVEFKGGCVHVVVSGDGKPLFESDVRDGDQPKPLDLEVRGVRDLEFLVDFAENLDIADHLDLADAKLIK